MLKAHLAEMKKAERAVARAAQIYAEQGHDDLYKETCKLYQYAHLARETIQLVVQAESAA
jgi:hypothetical protein